MRKKHTTKCPLGPAIALRRISRQLQEMKQMLQCLSQPCDKQLSKPLADVAISKPRKQSKASRDQLDLKDLELCLLLIDRGTQNRKVKARITFSCIFLYGTGLRVSNLLVLRTNHLISLKRSGFSQLTIPLIKTRKNIVQDTLLLPSAQRLLKSNQAIIDLLLECGPDQFIIQGFQNKRLSRESLTKELNKVLKSVGKVNNKTLSSHSFRIGYITRIIKAGGLEMARHLANHSSISTTTLYNRRVINREQMQHLLTKADGYDQ